MRSPPRIPIAEVVSDGRDIYVVVDDIRIARRGHPGTPEAHTWVQLVPGYTVTSPPDHSTFTIDIEKPEKSPD